MCFMLLRLICTVISRLTVVTLSKFGYKELQFLKNKFNESRRLITATVKPLTTKCSITSRYTRSGIISGYNSQVYRGLLYFTYIKCQTFQCHQWQLIKKVSHTVNRGQQPISCLIHVSLYILRIIQLYSLILCCRWKLHYITPSKCHR